MAAARAGGRLPRAVVNPRQIRAFAAATGRRAEAQVITLVPGIRPKPRPRAAAGSQALAELAGRRRQRVDKGWRAAMTSMAAHRLRQARNPRVQPMIRANLKTLEAQPAQRDRDIHATVRGSPVWRAAADLLISGPGNGEVTARTLVADRPEPGRLDRALVAATPDLSPNRGRR